ncbi:Hypothetical predicted protein [Octopus vulgaris]|uniref:Uncharacterized protein n=1 Tax=Octopus vulgaris TaxID=6645 RepID=A0AA36ARK0_OCTVU|nr:Hypothetical predicted protein [Octopus vulgaris]
MKMVGGKFYTSVLQREGNVLNMSSKEKLEKALVDDCAISGKEFGCRRSVFERLEMVKGFSKPAKVEKSNVKREKDDVAQ